MKYRFPMLEILLIAVKNTCCRIIFGLFTSVKAVEIVLKSIPVSFYYKTDSNWRLWSLVKCVFPQLGNVTLSLSPYPRVTFSNFGNLNFTNGLHAGNCLYIIFFIPPVVNIPGCYKI